MSSVPQQELLALAVAVRLGYVEKAAASSACRHGTMAGVPFEGRAPKVLIDSVLAQLTPDLASEFRAELAVLLADPGAAARAVADAGLAENSPFAATVSAASKPKTATFIRPGDRYTVKKEHARGGMGRVLLAMDNSLGREVALKELLTPMTAPGKAPTPGTTEGGDKERFLREARITGQLEHPNIVPVYEIGEGKDGTLFYTMKFVRGHTMAERLKGIAKKTGLTRGERLAERLKLLDAFVDVCNALAYAHSRNVINRDLKPANIMLGDFGETLVLDWGLARVKGQEDRARQEFLEATGIRAAKTVPPSTPHLGESDTKLTMDGAVLGTPSYMSPEQARGELEDVDEKSDVYCLGAILYEILTGTAPFEGPSAEAILQMVIKLEPTPVLEAEPAAPAELAAVVKAAIARDREARLSSAKRLADEVQAFRDGRAISLYRYTGVEQLKRFVKRNRALSGAIAAAVAILIAGTAVSIYYARDASLQSASARSSELDARKAEMIAAKRADAESAAKEEAQTAFTRAEGQRLAAVAKPIAFDNPGQALLISIQAAQRAPGLAANNALFASLYNLYEVHRLLGHETYVTVARLNASSSLVASGGLDNSVQIHDRARGKRLFRLDGHRDSVVDVAWSGDGRWVVSSSDDRTVRVWDPALGSCVAVLAGLPAPASRVLANADASRVVTFHGELRVWDVAATTFREMKMAAPVTAFSLSADGRTLLAGSRDGEVRAWDVASGEERLRLAGHAGEVRAAWFSPDGSRIVTGSLDRTVKVWKADGTSEASWEGAEGKGVIDAVWTADGKRIAARGEDSKVRMWDAATRAPLGGFTAGGWFQPESLNADGTVALRLADFAVDLVDTATDRRLGTLNGHEYHIRTAVFSRDGRWIVTASHDRTCAVWSALPGSCLKSVPIDTGRPVIARHPDQTPVLATRPDGDLEMRSAVTGEILGTLRPEFVPAAAAFCRNGTRFALFRGSRAAVYDSLTLRLVRDVEDPAGHGHALSGDGRRLMSRHDRNIRVRDLDTGDTVSAFELLPLGSSDAVFSWDGRRVATANAGRQTLSLYDADTGKPLHAEVAGHTGHALSVQFLPDNRRIISTAADASARIWDIVSGTQLGYYRWPRIQEFFPSVSPCGRWASLAAGATVRVISTQNAQEVISFDASWGLGQAGFTQDGSSVILSAPGNRFLYVPLDLLPVAIAAAPREILPSELVQYEIGTAEERRAYSTAYYERNPLATRSLARGNEQYTLQNYEAALDEYRRAIEIAPGLATAHYFLARARARIGQPDLALDALQAALERGMNQFEAIREEEAFQGLRESGKLEELLRKYERR